MQKRNDRMYKTVVLVGVVVTVMLSPLVSQAEIYRWTDANGKIHFSDKPVGEKAETLDIKVQKAKPTSAKTKDERKQRAEGFIRAREEERAERDKGIAEKKRLKKERKKNCEAARKEYKEITEAGAVYYEKKDGIRDYLEPGRRKKEEARLKGLIKKFCK